jgi:5-carboxymethyl-2-hydroxymuconate isomerase
MPVVNFEYTKNLAIDNQVKPFIQDVHHALVDIIKTDLLTCRTTIDRHQEYLIADGDAHHAFIQLSIRMLPGRSKETKDKLGSELLAMINQVFAQEIAKYETQIRVYLTEVDKDYYYGLQ